MRCHLILLIFALVSITVYAQSESHAIEGTVVDSKTLKGVGFVTCKALNAADSLLSYAMTNAGGGFKLAVDKRVKTVEFSLMGYRTLRIPINNMGRNATVKLRQDGITLKEVTVKAKPVTVHGDTINYNVAALKGKEDRYIEDVLKKIPGIEVADNGSIRYNGEAINQLKIEGQDLLGNRYNQATRNLPAEAVATVQVMENDQPIKALKNRVPSTRATLNIKLKNGYKVHPFGELKGNIGDGLGTIWNNGLTLINVAKHNQMLLTAKMNNSGTDLSENTQEHLDITDPYGFEPEPPSLVSQPSGGNVPTSRKRYLRNKSYSVGLNHIHKVGADGSLRTNITYFGTTDNQRDTTYHLYGGQTQTVLVESNRYRKREHTLQPQFRYELNSLKCFLIDELKGSLSFTSGQNTMLTNGRSIDINASRHPAYVQNKLQLYINSGPNSYAINSFTRWFRRSETLNVADTTLSLEDSYAIYERTKLTRFITKNTVSMGFRLFGCNLDVEYGLRYRTDRITIDHNKNDRTSRLTNQLKASYNIGYNGGSFNLELPVSVMHANVPWNEAASGTKTYFSPSLSWRHEFSSMWKIRVKGAFSRDDDDEIMTSQPYFSGYRTCIQTPDNIGWTRSKRASLTLSHHDLIRLFSWNTMLSASWRRTDHHLEYSYGERFTTVKPVWEDTKQRFFTALTNIDKTFLGAGFGVKGTLTYNRTEALVAQNGLRRMVKSNVASAVINLRWNKLSWLTLTNATTYNLSWQDRNGETATHNTLRSLFNTASAYVYPVKNISLSLQWELNRIEISHGTYAENNFIDASLRWVVLKRIELTASASNLLNRKSYEEASFDGLNYSYYAMPLRGREVLCGFTLKF